MKLSKSKIKPRKTPIFDSKKEEVIIREKLNKIFFSNEFYIIQDESMIDIEFNNGRIYGFFKAGTGVRVIISHFVNNELIFDIDNMIASLNYPERVMIAPDRIQKELVEEYEYFKKASQMWH